MQEEQELQRLQELQEDPLSQADALRSVLLFTKAVVLGVEGQHRSALGAAQQAEARYRASGVARAEIGSTALLARLSGDPAMVAQLEAFPADASPDLAPLRQVVQGVPPINTDWWLVRQLERIQPGA